MHSEMKAENMMMSLGEVVCIIHSCRMNASTLQLNINPADNKRQGADGRIARPTGELCDSIYVATSMYGILDTASHQLLLVSAIV